LKIVGNPLAENDKKFKIFDLYYNKNYKKTTILLIKKNKK
jgi:hypothetical protein